MNLTSKARLFLSLGLMGAAMPSIAADEKAKEPSPAAAQTAKPVSPAATPASPPAVKAPAAPVAAKPANNPDQDMSEALVKKINKSSGDIVLRSSDLHPHSQCKKPRLSPRLRLR